MATYKKFAVPEGYYRLKDLAKGEYIKRKATARKVYVKGEYNATWKQFSVYDAADINNELFLRGTTRVYAGFTY